MRLTESECAVDPWWPRVEVECDKQNETVYVKLSNVLNLNKCWISFKISDQIRWNLISGYYQVQTLEF